jgi:Rps23 Pro-64 3,4-dihydroxylase Tpa1-like proline 4-hydroxylase
MKGMTTLEPTSSRTMNRKEIANLIEARISEAGVESLKNQYQSSGSINHLIIDNLLPTGLANSISDSFPRESNLKLLNARQEKKYVGVEFAPEQKIIEECIYSFQENTLLKLFSSICSIQDIEGDPELYAGGISSMSNSCFLNPHIDNSHDRLRTKYRRLNLLYYVSRGWETLDGGQLVIYPNGIKNTPIEIDSLFNRLVVMRTDNKSLHGVKEVNSKVNRRKTISNYYFSKTSPTNEKYYNSTSFRGFPGETKKDIILRLNAFARTTIKSATGNFIGKYISTGYHRKEDHGEK